MKMRVSRAGVEFIRYAPGETYTSLLRATKIMAVSYAGVTVAQTGLFFFFDWLL